MVITMFSVSGTSRPHSKGIVSDVLSLMKANHMGIDCNCTESVRYSTICSILITEIDIRTYQ